MNQLMKKLLVPAVFAAGVSTMSAQSDSNYEMKITLDDVAKTESVSERVPVRKGAYVDDFATFGSIRAYGVDGQPITDAKVVIVPKGYGYARQVQEISKTEPLASYHVPTGSVSEVYVIPQGEFTFGYDRLKTEMKLTGGVNSVYLPLDANK